MSHAKPLVIVGAGGFAREVLDIVDAINAVSPTWDMLGFVVDERYGTAGAIINDKPILGSFEWLRSRPGIAVVCGVGAPEIRSRMVKRAASCGVSFATLVHPSVIRTRWIKLDEGVVIGAGCVLTNTIAVGPHVQVNLGCTIGHDVVIEEYVTISPGVHISGNVRLCEGAYIGTGANIIEKKTIGAWSVVGAGSTVVKDVPPNTTVVGVPAQVIKERPAGWHLNDA